MTVLIVTSRFSGDAEFTSRWLQRRGHAVATLAKYTGVSAHSVASTRGRDTVLVARRQTSGELGLVSDSFDVVLVFEPLTDDLRSRLAASISNYTALLFVDLRRRRNTGGDPTLKLTRSAGHVGRPFSWTTSVLDLRRMLITLERCAFTQAS